MSKKSKSYFGDGGEPPVTPPPKTEYAKTRILKPITGDASRFPEWADYHPNINVLYGRMAIRPPFQHRHNPVGALRISLQNLRLNFTVLMFLLIFFAVQPVQARVISGVASVSSPFGAPTAEMVEKLRADAAAAFRDELIIWLREDVRVDIDTANTVRRFALLRLVSRCLESAEEKTTTRGRVWSLSLEVPESTVRNALRAHNEYFDSKAASYFQKAQGWDALDALPNAISALCAAAAKITPAGESGGVNIDNIRAAVQGLFNKITVKTVGTVIDGRPGALPKTPPSVVVTLFENPVPNFPFAAFVQNGRQLIRLATDNQGRLLFQDQRIPFVHNGSMLTVSPDARMFLKSDDFIRYRDLGIRFARGQEPVFIYRIPALTYTLEYRATVQDNAVAIPADFSADAHVRRYLREFCGLIPAASGATPDLTIRIIAHITQTTHNDTEEEGVLMQARAEFRGANIEKRGEIALDRRYPFNTPILVGAYFQEASATLRDLIANTLSAPFR